MKTFLINTVKQLKYFSESLDKQSIFTDKPWAMIDEEFEMQKLIFRKNKDLIMSKNGQVNIGKWDYLSEAKSLLIDRGYDKILFNEGFINQGVMILKLDGTENRYLALANENLIPDLDVYDYLRRLRNSILNIQRLELSDGNILEIQRGDPDLEGRTGDKVYFDGNEVSDGTYYLKSGNKKYIVNQSRIKSIIHETKYKTKDGIELLVEQESIYSFYIGDAVFIDGKPAPDRKYKIGFLKSFTVRNGKIYQIN